MSYRCSRGGGRTATSPRSSPSCPDGDAAGKDQGGNNRMKEEKAKLIVQGMKEAGVDFAVGVPDAQFIEVYKMLERSESGIRYVGAASASCGDGRRRPC